MHWILDAAQTTLVNGIISAWNWGAAVDIPKTEFLRCVAPDGVYRGGHPSVRRLMSNPVLANEMDFSKYPHLHSPYRAHSIHAEVAKLIARRTERLLILNDEGCITTTIWPMPALVGDEEEGDMIMCDFLHENGVGEEELNDAVIAKGDGSGVWQEVDW
jgi:hypothetical protein